MILIRFITLLLLGILQTWGAPNAGLDTNARAPRLAILDLVELGENQLKTEASSSMRRILATNGKWQVLARDSIVKKLTEFNLNPNQICNNSQCAFDIGNILQADYVLYGTTASLGSLDAITLKLLNISAAKIVWTKVTESPIGNPGEKVRNWERTFGRISEDLNPSSFNIEKTHSKKSLAIVDLSENSFASRVFFERICTRIYGSTQYDLMSPTELNELLTALEVNRFSIVPSNENIIGLGQKLGVSSLIYSKLSRDGKSYVYRLSMFDIANKELVLEMPPQPTDNLVKLLDYEQVFFNTLFSKEKVEKSAAKEPSLSGKKSNRALWVSLGVIGVGGGVAAYWVDQMGKSKTNTNASNAFSPSPPPNPPPTE